MSLKSLTYTSLARLDLGADDLHDIHRAARELNAIDGITGLLVFNGTHFLQIVEGDPAAVDDLLARLKGDSRHQGLEVRDERGIEARSFPDWTMELVRVSASYFQARETIEDLLPEGISAEVRDRLLRMTESISRVVEL